jgi:hypothetical protein
MEARVMPQMQTRSGVALVTSLAIVMVVGVLVLGAMLTTQVELFVTRNDSTSAQAQYVAQAGLQTYKAGLFQNFRWIEGGTLTGSLTDACINSLAAGIDFDRIGSVVAWDQNRIVVPQQTVLDANGNPIGTFDVVIMRDPDNVSRITIQSVGRTLAGGDTRTATSTARATFVIRNSSTLEQAIFAGDGSGMRFLNGNTTVYGGIYVVGNRDNADELVWEANGNFSIFNSYDKTANATTLQSFLAADAMQSSNLCAALRVESGRIGVGGSTQVGTPDSPLLTVAVGRGLEDIDTSQGGTLACMSNKGVCVESPVGPFDIDNPPDFPLLDETLDTELCQGLWRDCVQDEAVDDGLVIARAGGGLLPTASLEPLVLGDMSSECADFITAALTSGTFVFNTVSVDCTAPREDGRTIGFEYVWNGSYGVFTTHGNLNFRGFDLRFDQHTRYAANSRDEDGTNRTFANLSVERSGTSGGHFAVAGSFVAEQSHGRFPFNVLSIVAEDTVHLGGGNNTYVTAPIYAGEQFRIREMTQLFGQVIANEFCTTNVHNACSIAGTPAEIVFVPTGENRAKSFRAIAPTGGIPTFRVEAYEMR